MKLKEYLEALNKLVSKRPEILGFDVIYASDDEGNSFQLTHYEPAVGSFEDGQFENHSDKKEDNVICLN